MTAPICAVDVCDYPAPNHRICVVCQAELTRDLAELPALCDDLEITLTRQARMGALGGGWSDSRLDDDPFLPGGVVVQPTPYDPRASEAAWVLRNTVVRWTRAIREPDESWPDDTVPAIARWLYARRLTLLDHVAAEQACDEIGFITREVRRITDRPANRTTFHVGPCPELDQQGVRCPGEIRAYIPVEDDHPGHLRCEACGVKWPIQLFGFAGRRILEVAKRRVS